jgi:hypothetical protein
MVELGRLAVIAPPKSGVGRKDAVVGVEVLLVGGMAISAEFYCAFGCDFLLLLAGCLDRSRAWLLLIFNEAPLLQARINCREIY